MSSLKLWDWDSVTLHLVYDGYFHKVFHHVIKSCIILITNYHVHLCFFNLKHALCFTNVTILITLICITYQAEKPLKIKNLSQFCLTCVFRQEKEAWNKVARSLGRTYLFAILRTYMLWSKCTLRMCLLV